MKLIDKSALVAEIERLKECNRKICGGNFDFLKKSYPEHYYSTEIYDDILSFLDTLEVKEETSIWNDAHKTIPEDSSNQIICIKEDDLAVVTVGKLVRGTKKWAYLNDLLNISDVEAKDVDLEKELETLDSLLYDLDGVAVKGTSSYLTVEDVKDIAKQFYELGLKAQKGE